MSSFSTHVYETPIYANLKVYPKRNIKKQAHKHKNNKNKKSNISNLAVDNSICFTVQNRIWVSHSRILHRFGGTHETTPFRHTTVVL